MFSDQAPPVYHFGGSSNTEAVSDIELEGYKIFLEAIQGK